ncbi:hypothetical protein VTJ04DRAFT_7614 [Mycothermus thermophilus]|uniref:uncharacterized protein n=1 Tax=Humicola insolens TaxID=85995 RepID=UPI0037421EBA
MSFLYNVQLGQGYCVKVPNALISIGSLFKFVSVEWFAKASSVIDLKVPMILTTCGIRYYFKTHTLRTHQSHIGSLAIGSL